MWRKHTTKILLVLMVILTGCEIEYYVKKGPEYGVKYQRIWHGGGWISKSDVDKGLALIKQYPEGTSYLAEYNHTIYNFSYQSDKVKAGNPVSASENNYKKFVALEDNASVVTTEFYNDIVDFIGFEVKFGNTPMSQYYKPVYVTKNYSENGIFYSDAKLAIYRTDLNTPGAVMRLKTELAVKDVKYLGEYFFHERFPQKENIVSFAIPSWLEVELIEKNFDGYDIIKSESKFTHRDEEENSMDGRSGYQSSTASSSDSKKNKSESNMRYVTYTMKNVKPMKNEFLEGSPKNNYPHVIVLCKNYDKTKAVSSGKSSKSKPAPSTEKSSSQKKQKAKENNAQPETEKIALISNVNDLYRWSYDIAKLTDNEVKTVEEKAKEITKDKTTDIDKIEAVFYWVQDNIRYVAYEDGIAAFKPDACQNVLSNRYGDCKGMANLLTQMLKSLGYDARLTWIGTKRVTYDFTIPTLSSTNHMICTVILNGKKYFLDGTEDYIGMDDYAHRIQGRPVMIEDNTNFIIDTVPDLPIERNLHDRTADFTIDNLVLKSKVKEIIKGENKTNFIRKYNAAPIENRRDVLLNHLHDADNSIEVSDISTSDLTDRKKNIELNYKLEIRNHVIKNANKLFVSPEFSYELKNHFADTARVTDITYGFKLFYTYHYSIAIPQGYKVKYLPKNIDIDNPEFATKVTYSTEGNKIKYLKSVKVKFGTVSKKNFKAWNEMLEKLKASYADYIMLEK
ncbi:MAG: transglutaminase domain-containing protein [Bacteroidia bacterium]